MSKNLEYYRAQPYTRCARAVQEGDGRPYWIVWVDELRGCKTDGSTYAEAMLNLDAVFDAYIQAKLSWKTAIPEPVQEIGVAAVLPATISRPMSIDTGESDFASRESVESRRYRGSMQPDQPFLHDDEEETKSDSAVLVHS